MGVVEKLSSKEEIERKILISGYQLLTLSRVPDCMDSKKCHFWTLALDVDILTMLLLVQQEYLGLQRSINLKHVLLKHGLEVERCNISLTVWIFL
jgi:hypothetical protein